MDRAFQGMARRSMSILQSRALPTEVMSAPKVRKSFLDFFCEANDHLHIRSSPVFSLLDPSLAFVNAGMNQFKDVFLGLIKPASRRVANSQKCIRITGKHNDLEQVGTDGSHHTFFEMLGSWSFDDYFKKEACEMSWDLLTKVYELPPERLYVTYFEGDDKLGLKPDLEVREIWREIGVSDSHIVPFGLKDNFWQVGTIGPCGPCTEIHYDHCSDRKNAGNLVNTGRSDLIELWNLVFIQYNRTENGELEKLKKHFVDTGMGFERLVSVLQGKTSNYDTDLFYPLFKAIQDYSKRPPYQGLYDGNPLDLGYRVLADHARMITVSLSDGMIPSQHHKIKKIIRKALAVSNDVFGCSSDLLKVLTNHVAESLSDAYPEIGKTCPKICDIIDVEANMLKKLRKKYKTKWNEVLQKYPKLGSLDPRNSPAIVTAMEYMEKNILTSEKKTISGSDTWLLYDTLGVPPDITQQLATVLDLNFSMEEFEDYSNECKDSKKRTREELSAKRMYSTVSSEILSELEKRGIEPTVDYFKYDYRVDGEDKYIFNKQPSTVTAIIVDNELRDFITEKDVNDGQEVCLLLDRTQLFSSERNQDSDVGTFIIENTIEFNVKKVIKIKGFAFHFGTFKNFPKEEKVQVHNLGVLKIDEDTRLQIMRNHSALHLVNGLLRDKLPIIREKFSSVTSDRFLLQFMFFYEIPTYEDLLKIEHDIRMIIRQGVPVIRMPLDLSRFQEMDEVITIPGEPLIEEEIPVIEICGGLKLFREHCKGTHVLNTADIKDFVFTEYKLSGSHLKTLEGVTGEKATEIREKQNEFLQKWRELEKKMAAAKSDATKISELISEAKAFQVELSNSNNVLTSFARKATLNKLNKEIKNLNHQYGTAIQDVLVSNIRKVITSSNEGFVVHELEEVPGLEDVPSDIGTFEKPVLMFYHIQDSVIVFAVVPENLVSKSFSAKDWIIHSTSSFGGMGRALTNENTAYVLKKQKLTEEKIRKAMNLGRDFAKKHIPK